MESGERAAKVYNKLVHVMNEETESSDRERIAAAAMLVGVLIKESVIEDDIAEAVRFSVYMINCGINQEEK